MAKGKINIDLSKFKHVSSDKNTTRLRHQDGHFLVVAHKKLGTDYQKQLEALSSIGKEHQTADQANEQQDRSRYHMKDGGKVPATAQSPDKPKPSPETSEALAAMREKAAANNAGSGTTSVEQAMHRLAHPWAEGGGVKMAEGGEPEQPQEPQQDQGLSEHIGQLVGRYGAHAVKNALTPIVAIGQGAMKAAGEAGKFATGVGQGVDQALPEPQVAPTQPQAQPEQAQPQMEAQQPQAESAQQAPQQPQDPYGTDAYMQQMQRGLGTEQQGLEAQQQATEQQGAARAAADVAYTKQMQQAQQHFAHQYQQNIDNIKATIADINANHINPRHYQENMTAGQKITTALGMLAGGMGSGFTHGENPAAAFFDKQIERDIDAQVKNQGNRQTLLNAYHQQYQNMDQAMAMTRATLSANYAAQLAAASDNAATPQAKANMLAKSGELQMKAADLAKQATMIKFMTQSQNNPQASNGEYNENAFKQAQSYLMLTNPEMAKARAVAHVPGVGDAPMGTSIPDNVKQNILAHKTMNDLMNMSLQFSQKPIPKNPAELIKYEGQAKTIQNQLIGTIKQAQQDGVYKPSEADYLLSQIGGSPGSVFADLSSVPKIKQLQESKQHEYNNLLSTYGLPHQQLERTPDKDPNEGRTATDANGTKLIRKNGKWIPLGK